MQNSRPRILFHARGSMTEDETSFYRDLNQDIAEIGGSFYLVGHHFPQSCELPFLRVPSGPHRVQLGAIHDSFESTENEALEFLLELDQLWHGVEQDKKKQISRVRALNFFQGYYKLLLDYIQPSLVVIWNGYHPQEKILAELAKQRGCKLGYVERGCVPGMIHYDPQGVLAASGFARCSNWCWTDNLEQEVWSGVFAKISASLEDNPQTWWSQPTRRKHSQIFDRLNLNPEKPILLFAGQVEKDVQSMFFSPNFSTCLDALKWVVSEVSKYPEWQLLGKHHPQSSTPLSSYKDVVAGVGVWVDDVDLADALSISSAVVAVNSTVLYESMIYKLPALSLGDGIFSKKDVFYEYDRERSREVFHDFINKVSFENKMVRFNDMMSYLVAYHLYDFVGRWSLLGTNGSKALAKRWFSEASENPCLSQRSEEYLEILRFFSDKASEPSIGILVQKLKMKFFRGVKTVLRMLK